MLKQKLWGCFLSFVLCSVNMTQTYTEICPFTHGVDTWGFPNTVYALTNSYFMRKEELETMKQQLTNVEKLQVQDAMHQEWRGDCYGMAVSAILAYHHILDYHTWDTSAACLYDVKPNDESVCAIIYYQQLQCINSTQQEMAWSTYYETDSDRMEKLLDLAKDGTPSLLCYNGHFRGNEEISGHAVVAYGYEEGTWEWDGTTYTARILIYDPNAKSFEDRACLYLDAPHKNWQIPAYQLRSEQDAGITFVTSDLDVLNNCGLVNGTHFHSEHPHFAFLKSTSVDGNYSCTKTVFNGAAWSDSSDSADIRQFQYAFGDSLNASDMDFLAPDLQNGYCFQVQNEQLLDVTMNYENIMMLAEGTGRTVRFSPDGVFSMESSGQLYHLEMISNEAYPGVMYYYQFDGNASEIQVALTSEGYVLQSDQLHNVTVNAIGGGNNDTFTFSTDAERVLIHETDAHKLIYSVDTDGDGTFETTVSQLGDVNQDGSINAKDATEVLLASACIGVGKDTGLNGNQRVAADVNSDEHINAVDATWILRYAAAIGTDSFKGSFNEFITNQH